MSLVKNIKKQAQGNNTKIQTSEAANLEKILNRMFYLNKNIEEETKFVRQVMTRGLESQERVGLHASSMLVYASDFCLRCQVLSLLYKQLQGAQTPVNLMRIFEEGNAIHEKWQRLFIRAGYGKAVDMDLTRFYDDYKLSFTPDIVCKIPEFYDGKMVGEIKSVNTFQFKKMPRHPSAWKQAQFYSYLLIEQEKANGAYNGKDYKKAFVLNEDKNTQEFKVEVYDTDPATIAEYLERAEAIMYYYNRVLNEKKMVARPQGFNINHKQCEKCAMKDACYNVGMGRIKIF